MAVVSNGELMSELIDALRVDGCTDFLFEVIFI